MSRFRDFDWTANGPHVLSYGLDWKGDMDRGTAHDVVLEVSFYNDTPQQVFGPYLNFDNAIRDLNYIKKSRWKSKTSPR